MAKKCIYSDEWICLFLEKLGYDPDSVQRIVVDAQPGEPLMVHIQLIADSGALEVRPPEPTEVQVVSRLTK